jgi:DNA-binding GntR family transcriptional regulator
MASGGHVSTDPPLTRAEWVDQRLRAAIIGGEFSPGQRLVTSQLAERWLVSPTPLRETYHRLAAEGLVELTPQRGARVAPLSLEDAHEIYAIRQVLEPRALRSSHERRDTRWEGDVRGAYTCLREQLEPDITNFRKFEEAHRAFHGALLARCPSGWLRRIIEMLQDQSVRYRLLSLQPRGGPAEVLQEHQQLMDTCLGENVEDAVARLDRHLQLTLDCLNDQHATMNVVAAREED